MEGLTKRQKLSHLVSLGSVSSRILAKIVAEGRRLKIDEPISERELQRAAFAEYTPNIALSIAVPLADGGEFTWCLCNPAGLLQRSVQVSPALRRLFAAPLSTPGKPWSIIIAHDEVTPGAVLRPDNKRKFNAFYFSFAEFGHAAVRAEQVWFPVAVLRSCIVDKVVGGLSCCLRLLLKEFARHFSQGVVFELDGGPTYLFARVSVHLGDEAALSHGLSVKGASGIKPCLLCANVVKKGSDLAGRRANLIEIDVVDERRFIAHTDESVWHLYDELVRLQGRVGVGEMATRQRAAGITLSPHSVLGDVPLRDHFRPVSSLCFDWQHTYLSNGIASLELFVFLKSCKASGLTDIYPLLERYCKSNWQWPAGQAQKGKAIHQVFNSSREKASREHWKSGASELLTVYPLVREFARTVVLATRPGLAPEVRSLMLCFRVLDLLRHLKGAHDNEHLVSISAAIQEHLEQHKLVYGTEDMIPKHHYAIHIGQQIRRHGVLFDCFVVERSHLLPKCMSQAIRFTGEFERSVIARVLLARLRDLETFDERGGLISADAKPSPELSQAMGIDDIVVCSAGSHGGLQIKRGDVVLVSRSCILVELFGVADGRFFLVGHLCNMVRRHSPTSATWRPECELTVAYLSDERVVAMHAWSRSNCGDISALEPCL